MITIDNEMLSRCADLARKAGSLKSEKVPEAMVPHGLPLALEHVRQFGEYFAQKFKDGEHSVTADTETSLQALTCIENVLKALSTTPAADEKNVGAEIWKGILDASHPVYQMDSRDPSPGYLTSYMFKPSEWSRLEYLLSTRTNEKIVEAVKLQADFWNAMAIIQDDRRADLLGEYKNMISKPTDIILWLFTQLQVAQDTIDRREKREKELKAKPIPVGAIVTHKTSTFQKMYVVREWGEQDKAYFGKTADCVCRWFDRDKHLQEDGFDYTELMLVQRPVQHKAKPAEEEEADDD